MNYNLRKPCADCPFRTDNDFHLTLARAQELSRVSSEFACHKTVDYSGEDGGRIKEKSEHCAGALILAEHMQRPHQMMRICERIGMYDASKLEMDSPVFRSHIEMISTYRRRNKRRA